MKTLLVIVMYPFLVIGAVYSIVKHGFQAGYDGMTKTLMDLFT